jgi:hypothetical protein
MILLLAGAIRTPAGNSWHGHIASRSLVMVAPKVHESRQPFHGGPKAIAELVKSARSDIIETDQSVSEYAWRRLVPCYHWDYCAN